MNEQYGIIIEACEARKTYLDKVLKSRNSIDPDDTFDELKELEREAIGWYEIEKTINNNSKGTDQKMKEFISTHTDLICASLRFYYYRLGMVKQVSNSKRELYRTKMIRIDKINKEMCKRTKEEPDPF